MAKWIDPRTPVSIEWVGRYKVTVFDQALYDESLELYPPDPVQLHPPKKREFVDLKKKTAFKFAVKLDKPLMGKVS